MAIKKFLTPCSHLQSKSTGQLSGTVYMANFLGCIARIFTTLQDGGGYAMVRGFLLGMLQLRTGVACCVVLVVRVLQLAV